MTRRQTSRLTILSVIVWISVPAGAQTQIDLGKQGKNVDFANAPSTRPVKTGTTLPSSCGVGEFFFLTSAPAGSNVYACVSTDVWAVQGGAGGGAGAVSIQLDGTLVGTRAIENFVNGTGLVTTAADTGTRIDLQQMADTAVLLTKASAQTGSVLLCQSSSGSAEIYACSMSPTLGTYTAGMMLAWEPDINGAGGPTTLNIDALGARPVKLADGTSDPTPVDILAGRLLPLWYDGTVFREIAATPLTGAAGALQPTCSAALRGRLWFGLGDTGVKDSFTVCAKDTAENYAWRTLY